MKYKLLKIGYINNNNLCYSEACINKLAKQYKGKEFNVYCANDIIAVSFENAKDIQDKPVYGKISNVRKEDKYLVCDLTLDRPKLKAIYNKCFLDNIYLGEVSCEDGVRMVNECEIGVHYFQNALTNTRASTFRKIIDLS